MLMKDTARAPAELIPAIGSESVRDYDTVRRALRFLSEQWQDQPDLDALAAHLCLSPAHCQKLFKRWCGLSPKEFVQAVTLDHARQMLEGSASVLDAAHEVGLSGTGRLHDLFVTHEAMTPGDTRRRGKGLGMAYGFHPTPFGEALAAMTTRGLAGLAFVDEDKGQTRDTLLAEMTARWPRASWRHAPEASAATVSDIFNPGGTRREIKLILVGTDWEVRVWRTLLDIPVGRAVSYIDVARHVCTERAARAVGTAVSKNPIAFVVPCHRVMRSDGGLGGYHWGLTRKWAIIGWEAGQVVRAAKDDAFSP